ncbi:DUF5702 domain-containing protein [Catonella massiliensis]|uniref:Uncharacterized protein n=1 Tax=Catonella massiliensis TaxID=2799636 RepID=A0ABS1IZ16_9FIRM|nr:DUF5702 domain-containing protein [Catonella massiliensis]MBK5897060.1 hypothetical protein [Catonella massiliensis]
MKVKGSITIFLSLALLFVTALIGSLLESARVTVAGEIALDNSYLAEQNILAEYQRELWNDYHIFFVDASLLNGEEGAVKLANSYMDKMMPGGKGDYLGTTASFTSLSFKENMTENNCYFFAKQAAAYMKYGAAAGVDKKLINNANLIKTAEDGTDTLRKGLKIKVEAEKKLIELEREKKKLEEKANDIKKGAENIKEIIGTEVHAQSKSGLLGVEEAKRSESSNQIHTKMVEKPKAMAKKIEVQKSEVQDDTPKYTEKEVADAKKKYKESQKNLDDATGDGSARGTLSFFISGDKKISKRKISSTAWGEVQTEKEEKTDLVEKGLLILYAKAHFKNFLSKVKEEDKKEALRYGLEYLIAGKESDEANLSSVANRIFGLRTIVWYGYFLTRKDKMAEAEAIAAAIASVLALPAAIEIIKYGIVMGWSMDEARKEVKSLLKGDDIPLLPGKSEGVKLKYQSFLDSFLVIASGKLPIRMVKLIEQNIKLRYYQGFRADSMYAGVNGEVSVKTMPRIFRLAFLDGIVQRKTDNWEAGLQLSQSLCRE